MGVFHVFLNCTNATKSCNASQIFLLLVSHASFWLTQRNCSCSRFVNPLNGSIALVVDSSALQSSSKHKYSCYNTFLKNEPNSNSLLIQGLIIPRLRRFFTNYIRGEILTETFREKSFRDFYSGHENDFHKYFSLANISPKLQCYHSHSSFICLHS